jgi:hypothetical protein
MPALNGPVAYAPEDHTEQNFQSVGAGTSRERLQARGAGSRNACRARLRAFVMSSSEHHSGAWRVRQSWLLGQARGEDDRMLLIDLERDTARRLGATTLVLASSHVPMISHPGETADFIERAALALADVD